MTVSIPVVGLYRGEFNYSWAIGASQRFISPTRNLLFFVYRLTNGCPDLHGTIPLVLYDEAGNAVASTPATLHGSGCAFNP